MNDGFEQKLAKVAGTIRRIAIDDPYGRYSGGLLYYSNKAQNLHDAAQLLDGDPSGHHFEAFALLAGFSLEVLIKGILLGLGEKVPFTHDLLKLVDRAGLSISHDDRAVLKAFTIYTMWKSRYPAAKGPKEMTEGLAILNAQYGQSGNLLSIVTAARTSSVAVNTVNYERLYHFILQRFFDVQSQVFESAEWSFNLTETQPS